MNPCTILIPVDERTDPAVLTLAAEMLGSRAGTIILLAVVELPAGRQPVVGAATGRAARHAMRRLVGAVSLHGVELHTRVRAARGRAAGVVEVADEERPDLLLLPVGADGRLNQADRALIAAPPCDTVIARLGDERDIRSVLVPARGGPTAELAMALGQDIATRRGAHLTLLHLDVPGGTAEARAQERRLFAGLLNRSEYPRLRTSAEPATAVAPALLAEAARHQVTVVGAAGHPRRGADESLGEIAEYLLTHAPGTVLVVKPGRPVDLSIFAPKPSIEVTVDKWLVENTFHCREFAAIEELVRLKQSQQWTVSVVLVAAGESETLASLARVVQEEMSQRAGLVDEVLALDDGGTPGFREAAEECGLRVCAVNTGEHERGRLLYESVQLTAGDLIVWLDADMRNMHPRFIYGLLGPLLREARIGVVTGFYHPPADYDDLPVDDAQVLTTEVAIRPLLNLHFPELSGVVNPLSRERAVRRAALTGMALPAGPGADLAMLLDLFERDGLAAIGQCDLEQRIGRPARMSTVIRRSFGAVQALAGRVERRPPSDRTLNHSMRLIRHNGDRYYLDGMDSSAWPLPAIRPPARSIPGDGCATP